MGKLPPRRKGSPSVPEEVKTAEAAFYRCPKAHALPHKTARGECTPLYCADTEGALGSNAKEHRKQKSALDVAKEESVNQPDLTIDGIVKDPLANAEGKKAKVEETVRIGKATGRHAARAEALNVPKGLTGQDAEDWADRRMVELLPLAVAEKEFQLRFGDDSARDKAASDILNATGRGKRDQGAAVGATIILVGAGTDGKAILPWAPKKSQLVESTAVIVSKPNAEE